MNTKQIALQEIEIINRTLRNHNIDAGVTPSSTMIAEWSHFYYGVTLGRGVKISAIRGVQEEVAEAISRFRNSKVHIRVGVQPVGFEVPHPKPRKLIWGKTCEGLRDHSMLLGRSFGHYGPKEEILHFDEEPHVLIAGQTGAGKSVLISTILSTLASTTSPDELRIILVDLKNEDLIPFKDLPHIEYFAGDLSSAIKALRVMQEVKQDRIKHRDREFRLLLVIDELAQIENEDALQILGSILAVGRSKWLNVIAATQHPLSSVIGSIAKANFPVRIVGRVADDRAANVASGRRKTGAEFLPGKGSFLRIAGNDTTRFQSYFLPDGEETVKVVQSIKSMYPDVEPMLGIKKTVIEEPNQDGGEIAEIAAKIKSTYYELRDDRKTHGVRNLSAVIKAAFGEDANTGGANRTRVIKAIEMLKTTTTSGSEQVAPAKMQHVPVGSSSSGRLM